MIQPERIEKMRQIALGREPARDAYDRPILEWRRFMHELIISLDEAAEGEPQPNPDPRWRI